MAVPKQNFSKDIYATVSTIYFLIQPLITKARPFLYGLPLSLNFRFKILDLDFKFLFGFR